MATAEQFFSPRNTRLCILYEYLRNKTPKEALIEFEKAKKGHVNLDTIMKWYARFKRSKYNVDIGGCDESDVKNDNPVSDDVSKVEYDTTLRELNEKYGEMTRENREFNDGNLLKFFENIKEALEKGAILTEVEISHNNKSQPKHILIAVEYYIENRTTLNYKALEFYHCSNGVVVRRGKATKILEGDDYKYDELAANTFWKLLSKFFHQSETFKIGLLKITEEMPTEEFFNVLRNNIYEKFDDLEEIVANPIYYLINLGKHLTGLEKLEIRYNMDTVTASNAKTVFEVASQKKHSTTGTLSALVSCVIHCNVPVNVHIPNSDHTKVTVDKDKITFEKQGMAGPSDQPGPSIQ